MKLKKRFGLKVQRTSTCWLWKGSTDRDGYGRILVDGKNRLAHRVAWELAKGAPQGLVLHRCDVRRCVRPAHLFVGTDKDNAIDCVRKGRHSINTLKAQGRRAYSKLTLDDVNEIKKMHVPRKNTNELAARFGVCIATILRASSGRTWSQQ